MPKGDKLTDKQEMFCKEYLIDLNATQAAIRSGYSKKTANRIATTLLSNIVIQKRLSQLKASREKRVQINADWVLEQAVKVHSRCMEDQELVLEFEKTKNGQKKYVAKTNKDGKFLYKFDSSGALKALDTIGKHVNIQAFKEKVENETNINHNIGNNELARQIMFALQKGNNQS